MVRDRGVNCKHFYFVLQIEVTKAHKNFRNYVITLGEKNETTYINGNIIEGDAFNILENLINEKTPLKEFLY